MQNKPLYYALIILAVALFVLGRLCDDLSWYEWSGIEGDRLEGVALAGVGGAAVTLLVVRLMQKDGAKQLFLNSQIKFFIPWALVILESILIFKIWGCTSDPDRVAEHPEYLSNNGCILNCLVLLLTNFVYSTICSKLGQKALLITFEIILFAEIIYNGTLIVKFIGDLKEEAKDYSILYISVIIAYQIIAMDLIFRIVYEQRERQQEIHHIIHKMDQHEEKCKLVSKPHHETEVRLNEQPITKTLNEVHPNHHPQPHPH